MTTSPSMPPHRREHLLEVFLKQLEYPGMEDREEQIVAAYAKTFQWVLQPENEEKVSCSRFGDWLESESGSQLYWVTGKAGSGKPTLIKYLCQQRSQSSATLNRTVNIYNNSRCSKYLRKWAGCHPVISATFFFCNSGTQLQRSQRGLLLSLLYQILQQKPEIISKLSPKRWEVLCLFNDDRTEWTRQELQQTFGLAVKEIGRTGKLCLFINGLDELDGHHEYLINLIKDSIANANVKVCVASRPWILFEDAFKYKPSMMLQDLTYSDIKYFVTSRFDSSQNFTQLSSKEPGYAKQLIVNVVSKASGLFLWVTLVVASLLAGMGHGDRVSDLQRRLDILPPDLEDLYEKILRSLDPFYLEHAAQLFRLVQTSLNPPPLLLLSLADEECLEWALSRHVVPVSQDEACHRTRRSFVQMQCAVE